jgi:hypothetical protein
MVSMAEGYDRTQPEANVTLGHVGEDLRLELAGAESNLVLSWCLSHYDRDRTRIGLAGQDG